MKHLYTATLLSLSLSSTAQVLVDSIPYPTVHQGFWGIHVTADTIFLGDDFSGDIYFSDHAGNILGTQSTGFTYNHGLIVKANSYLIAQDYTTNGAHLYEVGFDGTLLNTWTFPDVIGGHSSGIGGICADGDDIWYTMYYPDFDAYPYAYAYKWHPGDAAPMDTVPMLGAQPLGIALKGDTMLYVMDNNDEDVERIYAYDLTNETDLGSVDLPDVATDGDQSPRGLSYDGTYLYLVANREGGSAFAYQSVFIYAFDDATFIREVVAPATLTVYPTPAANVLQVMNARGERVLAELLDAAGRCVKRLALLPGTNTVDISGFRSGAYVLRSADGEAVRVLVR
ncbi:MAG TPA: hypothetical protein VHL57_05080 [Flavobacteriales bacterium]|jgi:hypothetical protein|nr:hypothetical protein [Flavobacteriales bacterium]